MHIEYLTTQVSASKQMNVANAVAIVKIGVELFVSNRSDDEEYETKLLTNSSRTHPLALAHRLALKTMTRG